MGLFYTIDWQLISSILSPILEKIWQYRNQISQSCPLFLILLHSLCPSVVWAVILRFFSIAWRKWHLFAEPMLSLRFLPYGETAYGGNSRINVEMLKLHSRKASLNLVAMFRFECNNKYFKWWCRYHTNVASFPGTEWLFSSWRINCSNFCDQSAANKESYRRSHSNNLHASYITSFDGILHFCCKFSSTGDSCYKYWSISVDICT